MTDTETAVQLDATTANIDAHLRAYSDPHADRRLATLENAWLADGVLYDPPFEGEGVEAIAALTDIVLTHYPDHTFRRTTEVEVHHRFARYGWELVAADGTAAVAGTDFAEIDPAGRLVRIVGFFGEQPPLS